MTHVDKLSTLFFLFTLSNNVIAESRNTDSIYSPSSLWYLSDVPDSGWHYDLNVGMEYEPAYTGSDEYSTELDFNARAIYKTQAGHRYLLSLGEVGGFFQLRDDLMLSAVLEYEEGRTNSDDIILANLPEQEDTIEGQISLVKRWGKFSLGGVLQPDLLDNGKGLVYFLGLGYDTQPSKNSTFSAALDVSFGNAEYFQTEVGISNQSSQNSGLAAYNPDSGYKSTTLTANYSYRFTDHWQLLMSSEIEAYGGIISDSPLVANGEGDSVNFELGASILYSF